MRIDYAYRFPEGECAYCGGKHECNEHPMARSHGGSFTIPCCHQCNMSKGKKGQITWLRWVRDNRPKMWRKIVRNHFRRSNWLSKRVQTIRDETPMGADDNTALEYLIVLQYSRGNYSAYSPDLPGCVATGRTRKQAAKRIREAIALHIDGLMQDGMPLPEPSSFSEYVEV